jgi:hypothetical protein
VDHDTADEKSPERRAGSQPSHHGLPPYQPHHVKPIDPSYQIVVRTVLWVIAGAVLVGLIIWWAMT